MFNPFLIKNVLLPDKLIVANLKKPKEYLAANESAVLNIFRTFLYLVLPP